TSTQLVFTVPDGATSGRIAVTNGTSTATSADDFTVITGPAVTLTDFTPKLGRPGTLISISGTGFDPDPIGDRVLIGPLVGVPISAASAIALQVTSRTSSGKLSVSTGWGTATSADDFFSVPGSYSASDVLVTDRAQLGTTKPVAIGTAGKIAL